MAAALRRVRIYGSNPGDDGSIEVEYEDTVRPNRRVFERYPARGFVTVTEAARNTEIPRRTLYNWINSGDPVLDYNEDEDGQYLIPMREIRRLLEQEGAL